MSQFDGDYTGSVDLEDIPEPTQEELESLEDDPEYTDLFDEEDYEVESNDSDWQNFTRTVGYDDDY